MSPAQQPIGVPTRLAPLLAQIGRLAHQQHLSAYVVGGCVRDWVLKRPTVDMDVAVEGDGIAFAKAVAEALEARITVHEQFGTAVLELPLRGVVGRRHTDPTPWPGSPPASREHLRRVAPFTCSPAPLGRAARGWDDPSTARLDVATCRRERYTKPAAYPKVTAGRLRDDLFRRDFTINAMAMPIRPEGLGRIKDPFGGLKDLRAKRLRILHPKSFLDDPSRILRAARFVERYGLTLEPATARCLREALVSGVLIQLNRGRLQKELARMLGEPDSTACLTRFSQWLRTSSSARWRVGL